MTNRKHFIDELNDLNQKVLSMGQEVLKTYEQLIIAFKTQDLEIAKQIIENDKIINEIEISINVDAYLLIAKQCPVAVDLRRIITALKISNDLERIADYSANISRYIIKTENDNETFISAILKLTKHFIIMLTGILEAFHNEDIEQALQINDLDEILDNEYTEQVKNMIKITKETTETESGEAIRAVLVIKQIERAGDHVTNIAENIVYLVNGKRVELN